MNLPNALTILRIFFVPLLVAALVQETGWYQVGGVRITNDWLSLGIFLVAAFTDLLDGYLARRWKQVTTIGTLPDPIADKLLISAALISLVQIHSLPGWMAVLIIGRHLGHAARRTPPGAPAGGPGVDVGRRVFRHGFGRQLFRQVLAQSGRQHQASPPPRTADAGAQAAAHCAASATVEGVERRRGRLGRHNLEATRSELKRPYLPLRSGRTDRLAIQRNCHPARIPQAQRHVLHAFHRARGVRIHGG